MTRVAQTLLSALLHPAELTCCSRACPERPSKARESDGKTGALLRPSVASVVDFAFPITRDHARFRRFLWFAFIRGYPAFLRFLRFRRVSKVLGLVFQFWQFRRLWQFWQFLHRHQRYGFLVRANPQQDFCFLRVSKVLGLVSQFWQFLHSRLTCS